ncbi:MAG TPA: hypothetical protein VMR76_00235 [Candidatus Saccharimonadia bacterium]|nr:hypothetical protein [Candidatus Saccharimonadia bacterium]
MNPQDNTTDYKQDSNISTQRLIDIQSEIIQNAKRFALSGSKTIKHRKNDGLESPIDYDWWANETSFDGCFWSVSYWDYKNNSLQIQITKLLLQENGRSIMTSYSIREDSDKYFPGFQIYEEEIDNIYRPLKTEEYVYLDRAIRSINNP